MPPTRREFVATSAALTLGAVLGQPLHALTTRLTQTAQPVFTPLRRNVGTFTMRGGTVGWLVNRGGVAVVDTQFPTEAQALLAGLRERSRSRGVDVLLNTHHHADHSAGNVVFRGVARRVVAHGMADQHMRRAPQPPLPVQEPPPPDPLYPDTTFTHTWSTEVGDERIVARHHGRGHTSGDAVVTFERANVVHLGDLGFHRRHPVVDRAAGASMRNWMRTLEQAVNDHARDTIYIFGHAAAGLPITGSPAEVLQFRDYLGAVLAFVERHVAAGRSREETEAMREPLAGFEAWGPFGQPGPRNPITVAWDEVTTGS